MNELSLACIKLVNLGAGRDARGPSIFSEVVNFTHAIPTAD